MALSEDDVLKLLQHQPDNPHRDETARLFRNGMAVTAHVVLEDFLKSRASEVIARCSGSTPTFSDLPAKLQKLATIGVVDALRFQVKMKSRDKEEVDQLIRTTSHALASTSSSDFVLSDLLFGRAKSNLNNDDITDLLSALNIKDAWGNITELARRMGFASISLSDDFRAASRRRNRAAHDGGSSIALGDLIEMPSQATAIAASFDSMISRAVYLILSGNRGYLDGDHLDQSQISLRFLDYDGKVAREKIENGSRASSTGPDVDSLRPACQRRARRDGSVIVYTERGIPKSWEVTDLEVGRP